ncbi:MAG TPA: toxin-antitoxin system HicB family antitoxin [Acidimicrobiales bacterium]|nr:toxin-antitoxin system HicB family antitoxin [Acidimicrobiales bacterium]
MRQLIARIDDELHERLRARADAEGRSMNAVVVEVLDAAVPALDPRARLRARLAAEAMLYVPPTPPTPDVPTHADVETSERGSGTAVSDALAAERGSR